MGLSPEKRKKLLARKKALKESSEGGAFTFVKADETKRVRLLPVAEDEENCMEIITFYLGEKYKRVVSPKTIGLPCAIYEKYHKIKEKEAELAKKIKPKKMYVAPTITYEDISGKKLNEKQKAKLALFTPGIYQSLVDLTLDPDHGDPADPKTGFDIKWTRTGSTMTDTEYSIIPGKESPLHKAFAGKTYDIMAMIKPEIPSYAKTKEMLEDFLGDDSDSDEDERPKKKKKKAVEEEEEQEEPKAKKEKVLTDEKGPYKIVERDGKKVKVRPKKS